MSIRRKTRKIRIMKNFITSEEIYKFASETTAKEFFNLFNLFTKKEEKEFYSLVDLGDSKEVALWTVIADRYKHNCSDENYRIAYES
jgi:hypothetical protein